MQGTENPKILPSNALRKLLKTFVEKRQTILGSQTHNSLLSDLHSIQQCAMLQWTSHQLRDADYVLADEAVRAQDKIIKELGS